MTAHELARHLLAGPDLPVATHANNHTALGRDRMRVGLLQSYEGEQIIIGNFTRSALNPPNWYVSEMIAGEVPENWPRR